ncbi:S8 family serine peptidase [Polyangium aurulentum]|uniref:S8 family serine peptidase n=1 Tax=Polyangium aurulentum TaxID=2567896 RepID=UPI0010AED139|nr:S8 family serine peptidase [Polyangium aurulentum]UQA56770.1 S8 family serine peptidase [Polyangium aurulentum]
MKRSPSMMTVPLLLLLAAPAAHAAERAASFEDGDRVVEAERLGAAARDSLGRSLVPVRLRYEDRTIEASIDRTALVRIAPGASADLESAGVRLVRPIMPSIGIWLAEDEGEGDGLDVAARLSRADLRGAVLDAVPNLYLRTTLTAEPFVPDDPRLSGQWYFDDKRLRMTEAWGISQGDAGTTIVVVDSGCDLDHPDLAAKMDPGLDAVDGDTDATYEPGFEGRAHGTQCAGLAAAATNNGVGMAGACPECRLRCVRMLSGGDTPLSAAVEAFNFAKETGAAVVSNSWGFADPFPVPSIVRAAIEDVFDNGRGGKGAVVLFAAGNDNRAILDDEIQAVRGVINVGAINQLDDKTFFTNFGPSLDLVAPVGTLTTDIAGSDGDDPSDYTTNFSGTSSACPVAAGVAALVASAAKDKTAAEIEEILIRTARPAPYALPDGEGHDEVFGYGIVDPVAALSNALEGTTPPPAAGDPVTDEGCACRAAGGGSDAMAGGAALYVFALGLVGARRARRR